MVLDVSPLSPLSEYLAHGDLIVSLNGICIRNPQEWVETIAMIRKEARQCVSPFTDTKRIMQVNNSRGYCIPISLIEESLHFGLEDDQTSCSHDLTVFKPLTCAINDNNIQDFDLKRQENVYCLSAGDIVGRRRCGDWERTLSNASSCLCSEVESCLAPVLMPGVTWIEVTYSQPNFQKCQQIEQTLLTNNVWTNLSENGCGGTFVFFGDVASMAHALNLTAFQPRWSHAFAAILPHVLEKLLQSFHMR